MGPLQTESSECVCVCARVHACMHVCLAVFMSVSVCICMCMHACMRVCVRERERESKQLQMKKTSLDLVFQNFNTFSDKSILQCLSSYFN